MLSRSGKKITKGAALCPVGCLLVRETFRGVKNAPATGICHLRQGSRSVRVIVRSPLCAAMKHDITTGIARAIDEGESYLLARIRAREWASYAPVDSRNKWAEGAGEAFLITDPVLAVGERMTDEDRRSLIARLLKSQKRRGTWSYRSAGTIDADTTASAIRALDCLGHRVPLDGLKSFFIPSTGLYNTFHEAAFSDPDLGLQLPPQTLKKHRGSHPCVLANVYLALLGRNELSCLSDGLLDRLQKPDGTWWSYFYPSPFYSTRLFTELLTSLETDHQSRLRKTFERLLASSSADSPSQNSEILISLYCLRRRLPDGPAMAEKIDDHVRQILAAQTQDGSWPGEVIWEYAANPFLIGFDRFRVRSTALCLRALKLWRAELQ